MSNAVSARTRVGRPCAVCSLPSDQRTILESALAAGKSISSISAQTWAPGRASIRAHIQSGHLPAQIQDAVERLTGLDSTTIAARIVDAAARARETAITAVEQGAHLIALRAGDSEVRALSMLATMGETSEADVEFRAAVRDIAAAVYRLAQHEPDLAQVIADELDLMHRPRVADDLRDHIAAHQIGK